MYELVQVGENTYYIQCPAKMGVYVKNGREAYLIDSGNDKEAGKKVLKIFEEKKWTLAGIINTHANADHIGGNKLIQDRTGCSVYMEGIDKTVAEYPILEPAFLYGGYPPKPLQNKFLMAQPSKALDIADVSFPKELEVVSLPGHFFHMFGIRTPDSVMFLADCLFGENILNKYHVSFIYDVKAYLDTLDAICKMEDKWFVPAHADTTENIRPLADANKAKVQEIADRLAAICKEPVCFEDILQQVFDQYGLTMDFNQYVLVGSTVRSYLSYLLDTGRLEYSIEDNRLLWKQATK